MNQLIDINKLSSEELELLQQKIFAKKLSDIEKRFEGMERENERINVELDTLKADQQKTVAVAANSLRVKQGYEDYVSQGDFGRFYSVSIGSQTVGKLLKVVGLAQLGKGRTTPYREYVPRYARTVAKESYTEVKWHYVNCSDYIDRWLEKNELLEQFYSIQSEREMEAFINQLYGEMHS